MGSSSDALRFPGLADSRTARSEGMMEVEVESLTQRARPSTLLKERPSVPMRQTEGRNRISPLRVQKMNREGDVSRGLYKGREKNKRLMKGRTKDEVEGR